MVLFLLAWWGLNAPEGPQINFSEMEHHFGTVERGDRVSHVFHFTNSGDADLVIERVRTSCGCTTAKLGKKVYKPGESGNIPVTFDSTEFTGAFAKAVRLTTNEGRKLEWELVIRGDIVQDIELSPEIVRGDARRGTDQSFDVTVSTRLPELKIQKVEADAPYFSVDWRRADARTCVVTVTVLGDAVAASRTRAAGQITLYTNSERQPRVSFRAEFAIVEAIKAEPRSINFFAVKQGARRTRPLELISIEGKPFSVTGFESSLDFIQVTTEADRMTVLFTGEAEPGSFSGTLTLKTDLAEMPTVSIPVRGSVRAPSGKPR